MRSDGDCCALCHRRLADKAKSTTCEEVARQIVMVLSTELGISSTLLVGEMRDRASVNEVPMRTVRVIYNQAVDIGCFSHTLDHVGKRMQTPILENFFYDLDKSIFT